MQRSNTDPKLRLPGIQRLSLAIVFLTAAAPIAATATVLRYKPQIPPVGALKTNVLARDRIDTNDKRTFPFSLKAQPKNHGSANGRQSATWEFTNSSKLQGLLLLTICAHGNRY